MRNALRLMLLLMLTGSCSVQEVCDDEAEPGIVARFKRLDQGIPADTLLTGVSLYGIREGKTDSLLLDSVNTSIVSLPPDPGNDGARFVLSVGDSEDTLVINYQREFYLVSYSCGFAVRFTLNSVRATGPVITGTEIIRASVNGEPDQNEEHLWIYF